ncbi:HesA/MoeB/ThiF family protein [Shewanella fidelis]|uniref:HesA/MoeB/ThiF family protein n=1 Tax=Shewanella fidelis TaxID=173509 RepID=UPI0004B20C6E|nr:HesA/MoeB/ThiF family protein [Shewanella fidelis]
MVTEQLTSTASGNKANSGTKALSDSDFLRYSRQVLLAEVGESGQAQFANAHVIVIGVGGLGNLVAQYLAAAGVGNITLVDGDKVEVSNLPRQLLFHDSDIGVNKAVAASAKLTKAYTQVRISAVAEHLTATSMQPLFKLDRQYDVLLDCSDNFETRQLVNRIAVSQNIALVSASAAHFQGQLLCIEQQYKPDSGCYHCLFPADMKVNQTCQTIGVLGPMVGTLASMQSLMALQLLLGNKQLVGNLYRFDGKQFSWRQLIITRDESCSVCGQASHYNECVTSAGTANQNQHEY